MTQAQSRADTDRRIPVKHDHTRLNMVRYRELPKGICDAAALLP